MIDLHHHCLPGIDDGPASMEAAVDQCRLAWEDGIETIVATPHVLRDPWINDSPAELDRRRLELNDALSGHPRILPGCEYWLGSDAIPLASRGASGPLVGLNRTGYQLVEVAPFEIPGEARNVVYEWGLAGITAVIAHPERNPAFRAEPEKLAEMVALGCLTQLTAMSLTGGFGAAAQEACSDFFRRGLVHLIASDAHSKDRRPPVLSRAREWVRGNWGSDAEEGLFAKNPAAVLEGERPPYVPDARGPRRSLLSRARQAQ